jgi:hypothetical protein
MTKAIGVVLDGVQYSIDIRKCSRDRKFGGGEMAGGGRVQETT